MANKRPAMMWYPGDWFRENGLKGASIQAKGMWAELIFSMHDAELMGLFPATLNSLGRMFGIASHYNPKDVSFEPYTIQKESETINAEFIIKELSNSGVCDLEFENEEEKKIFWSHGDNAKETIWFNIINRRMYREFLDQERISQIRSEAGSKGGKITQANAKQTPSKKRAKLKQNVEANDQANSINIINSYQAKPEQIVEANAKQNKALSSSSSSSSSSSISNINILKKAYGENKMVLLTNEEVSKLKAKHGSNLRAGVERLDAWIFAKAGQLKWFDKNYSGAFAVLNPKNSWIWEPKQNGLPQKPEPVISSASRKIIKTESTNGHHPVAISDEIRAKLDDIKRTALLAKSV